MSADAPALTSAQSLDEVLAAAFAEEFEEFAATSFVRKAVRASIAGKVKRRSLLELGYAHGCKTGNMAAGLIYRGTLAKVLGLPPETDWEALLDGVQGLAEGAQSPTAPVCEACGGTGEHPEHTWECDECDGVGTVEQTYTLRPFDIREHTRELADDANTRATDAETHAPVDVDDLVSWAAGVLARVAESHDSHEPVEEAQASALMDALGSSDHWVGELMDAALSAPVAHASPNISVEAEKPIVDALAGADVYQMEVDGDVAVPSDVGIGLAVCLAPPADLDEGS